MDSHSKPNHRGFSRLNFLSLSFRRKKKPELEMSSAPCSPSCSKTRSKYWPSTGSAITSPMNSGRKWSNLTNWDSDASDSGEDTDLQSVQSCNLRNSHKRKTPNVAIFSRFTSSSKKEKLPGSDSQQAWPWGGSLSFGSHSNSSTSEQDHLPITMDTDDLEDENGPILVTALYSFHGQMEKDLSFTKGDEIEVLTQTMSQYDWWEGRIGQRVGIFPANYVIASVR